MPRHDALRRTDGERPLKELVTDLGRDTGQLIQQEVALAKAELGEKASQLGKGAVTMGIGAVLAYAGVLAIVAAALLVLIEIGVTPWLAALIVGLGVALLGYALVAGARRRLAHPDLAPRRTRRTTRDTVAWAKEQLT
ncbi:MAG: phage holin family protein [Gemmatimonadales bacterium]